MTTQNLVQEGEVDRWEQSAYALLAGKGLWSGSLSTVRAYSGIFYQFFGSLGKPPEQVTAAEDFSYLVCSQRTRFGPLIPIPPEASPAGLNLSRSALR